MVKTTKPILVTGSHRSGSTWTGKMLAAAPSTRYIHEPFNIDIANPAKIPFTEWFQYLCAENAKQYQASLEQLITGQYSLSQNLSQARTVKSVARAIKNKGASFFRNANHFCPIVKDPIAIFSAPWLHNIFDMNVIVMIRHPAAFCSSLKLKNWTFDFSHFLRQPLLMSHYLEKFEMEIQEYAKNKKDVISQGILLWNCIHHAITIYQKEHPEWLFVKHETLSSDPLGQFQTLYESLGLEFTTMAKSAILESSGAHNAIEQIPKNEFVRNSTANILNWKKRLSDQEIQKIHQGTLEISESFYSENEW